MCLTHNNHAICDINSPVLASYTPWWWFYIFLLLAFHIMGFSAVISELNFQFIRETKTLI